MISEALELVHWLESARSVHAFSADHRDGISRCHSALRSQWLDLLGQKRRDEALRKKILEEKKLEIDGVEQPLDDDPDIAFMVDLSDELDLNEAECVRLLMRALEYRGDLSCEAAAGIYFDDRREVLEALHFAMKYEVLGSQLPTLWWRAQGPLGDAQEMDDFDTAAALEDVRALNSKLCKERDSDGRCKLLRKIVELIAAGGGPAGAGKAFPDVLNPQGATVPRSQLRRLETTLLVECLFYLCHLRPDEVRKSEADVRAIVELFAPLAEAVKRAAEDAEKSDAADDAPTAEHHLVVVLLAVLCLLSPPREELEDPGETEKQLASAARVVRACCEGLERRLEAGKVEPLRGLTGVLLLSLGTLEAREQGMQDSSAELNRAAENGAFGFLNARIVSSLHFRDDLPAHQQTYAEVLHDLLSRFLDWRPGSKLAKKLIDAEIERERSSSADAMDIVPARRGSGDDLAALLSLLAALFAVLSEGPMRHPADDRIRQYETLIEMLEEEAPSSPAALLGLLPVLTALAGSPGGAKWVADRLGADGAPGGERGVSWAVYAKVMSLADHKAEEGELIDDEDDEQGLARYTDLFTAVIRNGVLSQYESMAERAPNERVICTLERVLRKKPDRLLCSMMCRSAWRPDLKAALMKAVGALVGTGVKGSGGVPLLSPSELLSDIWADGGADGAGMCREIALMIADPEAQFGEYTVSLAFVSMVNVVAEQLAAGDGSAEQAFKMRQCTELFMGTSREYGGYLAQLYQRHYKHDVQRWDVAAECLKHMRLCLAMLQRTDPATVDQSHPGFTVLCEILSRGPAMSVLLQIAGVGCDRLHIIRERSDQGPRLEAAVREALRVLRAAFDVDRGFFGARGVPSGPQGPSSALVLPPQDYSSRGAAPFLQTLDTVLLQERRTLATLFEYVRYSLEPQLQIAALEVAGPTVERVANLVGVLAQHCSSLPELVHGFAGCMDESLSNGDRRAALAVSLLRSGVTHPFPTFSHLLLGFQVLAGSGLANPRTQYNALHVLIKRAAENPGLSAFPGLLRDLLALVCALLRDTRTRDCTLDVLRAEPPRMFAGLLDDSEGPALLPTPGQVDAGAPFDARAQVYANVALEQRTCLLQILAAELYYSDPLAGEDQRLSAEFVLQRLFAGVEEDGRSCAVLQLLGVGMHAAQKAPTATPDAGPAVAQAQALLRERRPVEAGGVWRADAGGVLLDVDVPELLRRLQEGGQGLAPDVEAQVECAARDQELWEHGSAERERFLAAWRACLEVAVCLRDGPLKAALGCEDAQKTIFRILSFTLAQLDDLFRSDAAGAHRVAPPVCRAVCSLLAHLRASRARAASLAASGDPHRLIESRLGVEECSDLLRQLLALEMPQNEAVRVPIYTAALSLLHYCRGPQLAPRVLEELAPQAETIVSLAQTQAKLDNGIHRVIAARAQALARQLCQDATLPRADHRAAVLHLTAALAAACPSFARELYESDLPRSVLRRLVDGSVHALKRLAPDDSRAEIESFEAKLSLLLTLAHARAEPGGGVGSGDVWGQRTASALQLFEAGAVQHLTSCQAFDLVPEDAAAVAMAATPGRSLRERLQRITTPILQLVVTMLAALPNSNDLHRQAGEFAAAHARALVRMLHDAGDVRSTAGWERGHADVEEAGLVLSLLCRLQEPDLHRHADLHFAVLTLARQLCCRDEHSGSRYIRALLETRGQKLSAEKLAASRRIRRRVLEMRCSLARYLARMTSMASSRLVLPIRDSPPGDLAPPPSMVDMARLLHQVGLDAEATLEAREDAMRVVHNLGKVPQLSPEQSQQLAAAAQDATDRERDAFLLVQLAESALQTVLSQLQKYLDIVEAVKRRRDASEDVDMMGSPFLREFGGGVSLPDGASGYEYVMDGRGGIDQKCIEDLESLSQELAEPLKKLVDPQHPTHLAGRVVGVRGADLARLQDLARRTREQRLRASDLLQREL
ncbi:unnamed protein product [Pedinophyceae sp. YPF-701]|nr:unnamed protein product [Pedinophyceae sp. YPF-701]